MPRQNKRDHAVDNTATNSTQSRTADDQGMNSTDTEMTQTIRQRLMDEKSLSTYAQNVKIISSNGWVTLSGPVRTEAERNLIAKRAAEVAGTGKVVNQLQIARN